MPRQSDWDDEWDESSPVEDVDDDEPTIPCPYCRHEIHEDSERCPYCEQYLSREEAPPGAKPWWLIAGVVLSLLVVCLWIISR